MAYKVLEQNGVTNENVDGAGFNYFASGKRDGILGGILNECAVYSPASNIVSISTGVISVQGFRVKITSDISWAVSGNADEYSVVFEIVLNPDRSVSSQFIAQPSSLSLVKDDLLVTEKGTHQIEVIRFTWDGDAVSNISRRLPVIIAGSGGGGVSIELAQDVNGASTEKAVSQKAVKDALEEKPDKITKTWQAYTTDGNGNTVAKPLAENPSSGAVAIYNEGGILKTNAPVEDNDAANKKYVDNGFVARSNEGWKIYGTGDGGSPLLRNVGAISRAGVILSADIPTAYAFDNATPISTIGVCDPQKPIQAANKRYVDAVKRDVKMLQDAALGVLYTFESVKLNLPYNAIPNGALPTAYIESIAEVYVRTETFEIVEKTEITALKIVNDNRETLATLEPNASQYFEIPEGATQIELVFRAPTVEVWDHCVLDVRIKYQVKVGG